MLRCSSFPHLENEEEDTCDMRRRIHVIAIIAIIEKGIERGHRRERERERLAVAYQGR